MLISINYSASSDCSTSCNFMSKGRVWKLDCTVYVAVFIKICGV